MTGIYTITCKKNGRVYIGSSIDVKRRWREHKSELKLNKHHSKYLQRDYNKYGKDSFKWEIIHECVSDKKEDILRDEQFYIDTLKPEFNDCKIAGSSLGYKHTEDTRKKISKLKTGIKQDKTTINKRISRIIKPVIQLSLDDNIIKEWSSIKDASIYFNINSAHISACCKSKRKTCGGFKWIYK